MYPATFSSMCSHQLTHNSAIYLLHVCQPESKIDASNYIDGQFLRPSISPMNLDFSSGTFPIPVGKARLTLSLLISSSWAHTFNLTSTSATPSSSSLSIQSSSTAKAVSSTPTPSSTTRPTPSSSSSSKPGVKNSKRGIAFASNGNTDDIVNANQTKGVITWIYDWADLPPAYIAQSNLKYIPMQWGSGAIEQLASAVSAQGADTILAFNEPDFVNEANIAPKDAAALWAQFLQPLKQQGIRLGGPAVTAAPTGKAWLTDFLSECNNCTIDFLPLHWYGSGTEGFYNYIWDMHSTFPQFPIWITEYADTGDNTTDDDPSALRSSEVWDFMNQTINYLDSLDWIERYSWFGFFRPEDNVSYNMLGDDGSLNDLGKLYIGANTIHTSPRDNSTGPQYQTVSPSDLPGQPLVTSWPKVNASASLTSSQYLLASIVLIGATPWYILHRSLDTSFALFQQQWTPYF
ncbi:hypothetical protein NP233_g8856 [Leucocoprinus birnbaumii]|uniref:Asl1-like glycosyl hydrolase catalytic domain-containing protein n=1 Tax=Leucocoprinus birnbaumii TaxID=56174 RepID=A0AAD5VLI9_9AGAR|nr:hypothetical protein NP233_g8856 [Leucocoprinus birnbaumii]